MASALCFFAYLSFLLVPRVARGQWTVSGPVGGTSLMYKNPNFPRVHITLLPVPPKTSIGSNDGGQTIHSSYDVNSKGLQKAIGAQVPTVTNDRERFRYNPDNDQITQHRYTGEIPHAGQLRAGPSPCDDIYLNAAMRSFAAEFEDAGIFSDAGELARALALPELPGGAKTPVAVGPAAHRARYDDIAFTYGAVDDDGIILYTLFVLFEIATFLYTVQRVIMCMICTRKRYGIWGEPAISSGLLKS